MSDNYQYQIDINAVNKKSATRATNNMSIKSNTIQSFGLSQNIGIVA